MALIPLAFYLKTA